MLIELSTILPLKDVYKRQDYHHLVKLWFLYAPASIALVLLTFTGLGLQRAGADDRAWLNLGFTTLQDVYKRQRNGCGSYSEASS